MPRLLILWLFLIANERDINETTNEIARTPPFSGFSQKITHINNKLRSCRKAASLTSNISSNTGTTKTSIKEPLRQQQLRRIDG